MFFGGGGDSEGILFVQFRVVGALEPIAAVNREEEGYTLSVPQKAKTEKNMNTKNMQIQQKGLQPEVVWS